MSAPTFRHRTRSALALTAASVLATTALTSGSVPAHAVTTMIGSNPIPSTACSGGITFVQTDSPGDGYAVPGDGVLTAYRIQIGATSAGATARFKAGRRSGSAWQVVGSGPARALTPDEAVVGDVRIPVRADDGIGLYVSNSSVCSILKMPSDGYSYSFGSGDVVAGGELSGAASNAQLSVSATWEPDADRDGYGDRSQDLCPRDPSTQAVCGTGAPQTRILGATTKRGKVTVRFAASEAASFRCAVDSAVFRGCRSPFVKRLKPGRHSIAVVATDRYGNVDASPAVKNVRVKKERKPRRR